MSMNLVTLLYLVASICFIQALKGLSHPTTSIRGNMFGMTGMAIAVLTTAALIVNLAGQADGLSWVLLLCLLSCHAFSRLLSEIVFARLVCFENAEDNAARLGCSWSDFQGDGVSGIKAAITCRPSAIKMLKVRAAA